MLELFKESIAHQYEAALCTLRKCVDACPEPSWHGPVVSLTFDQVAFHALFFTDYYLGPADEQAFRRQPFHRDRPHVFRDYEELQPRQQRLVYERPDIVEYLSHCRGKAAKVIAEETTATLAASCGFPRKNHSRAELHVLNIRHVQHHAAQLSLRLRLDGAIEVPWVGTGWN
jgi:hypothetical protein